MSLLKGRKVRTYVYLNIVPVRIPSKFRRGYSSRYSREDSQLPVVSLVVVLLFFMMQNDHLVGDFVGLQPFMMVKNGG